MKSIVRVVHRVALVGAIAIGLSGCVERRPPEEMGLMAVGEAHFPLPGGVEAFEVPGGSFEPAAGEALPSGWSARGEGIRCVADGDGPQGTYLRMPAEAGAKITGPGMDARGNQPFLLSFWWRSKTEGWAILYNNAEHNEANLNCCGAQHLMLPSTAGRWRRIGLYGRAPWAATRLTFQLRCRKPNPGTSYGLDDMRLRTATEDELSAAWHATADRTVDCDHSPREGDGRHLALTVRKLQGGGMPGRPFVVWALGSSWTNFLGSGEDLRQVIRQRFPDAPVMVYKKHMGSGTPYEYLRGWVSQFVAGDYPDLVLMYTNGEPSGLDAALRAIRSACTADIIVAPVHFWASDETTWRENVDTPYWDRIREACRAHGVEYVENRRELARYLEATGGTPKTLLSDGVHQNPLGRLLINLNISRHFAVPQIFAYSPDDRERRIRAEWALRGASADVHAFGPWSRKADRTITTGQAGSRLMLTFQGNRVDLLGRALRGGGTVRVKIDGFPAGKLGAFAMTYIRADPSNHKPRGPLRGDLAPHAVSLGSNVVPQEWTFTLLDDEGGFELTGSVTGADGRGNCRAKGTFVSDSGQIAVAPALWRHAKHVKKGDTYRWRVYRCTSGEVSFAGAEGSLVHQRLAQNLETGRHTVELEVVGDGPVAVDSFYVFNPPE